MKWCAFLCLFFLTACVDEAQEKPIPPLTTDSSIAVAPEMITPDTAVTFAKDTASHESRAKPIKKPSGIYQFLLPYNNNTKILHTIAFYSNTFRLQEEYPGKKDSIVITEGTWAPSQGFIWLYQGHVTRGRYTWDDDTLQYYSPSRNEKFSLMKMTPASANKAWLEKEKQGAVLFAIGTEPFWSVEVNKADSIILSMPDWAQPLRAKISTASRDENAMVYSAVTDSLQVTILPYFCSDGMSDFIYSNKVTVQHRGKRYEGCGMRF